ncbi:MAG: hypothetical protein Q9220_003560 [cf. Caloplaca sp. 1 TL-2023]
MSELLWNSAVHATPSRFVSALESALIPSTTEEARRDVEQSRSQTHAQKSESMRNVLGMNGTGILSNFRRAKSFPAAGALLPSKSKTSPPGLGNWDNSCYQNSVIQGLTSLPSFAAFLNRSALAHPSRSTKAALKDIMEKLKDQANLGTMFWTPAQLKSMSSWQQQDAQEYFSKLMDEMDKETAQQGMEDTSPVGLAAIQTSSPSHTDPSTTNPTEAQGPIPLLPKDNTNLSRLPSEIHTIIAHNPLEGQIAQRVGCLKCGYVEGLSLTPFNCLTLSLGKHWLYDIRSCLDDYTTLEPINGVDCAKCTLLNSQTHLEKLRHRLNRQAGQQDAQPTGTTPTSATGSLQLEVEARLQIIKGALESEDFSENTVLKKCDIPAKNKVSSTKTRQAVIARAPRSLAIHINRSVFDERSGTLSKNYADVRFPLLFSLRPWCLGAASSRSPSSQATIDDDDDDSSDDTAEEEHWNTNPSESMLPEYSENIGGPADDSHIYELRAALTHYGRHENGHYICYRRHGIKAEKIDATAASDDDDDDRPWWRFSDEDVSPVSEEDVLAQGDVFMLFYEKVERSLPPPPPASSEEDSTMSSEQTVPDLAAAEADSSGTNDTDEAGVIEVGDQEEVATPITDAQDQERAKADPSGTIDSDEAGVIEVGDQEEKTPITDIEGQEQAKANPSGTNDTDEAGIIEVGDQEQLKPVTDIEDQDEQARAATCTNGPDQDQPGEEEHIIEEGLDVNTPAPVPPDLQASAIPEPDSPSSSEEPTASSTITNPITNPTTELTITQAPPLTSPEPSSPPPSPQLQPERPSSNSRPISHPLRTATPRRGKKGMKVSSMVTAN